MPYQPVRGEFHFTRFRGARIRVPRPGDDREPYHRPVREEDEAAFGLDATIAPEAGVAAPGPATSLGTDPTVAGVAAPKPGAIGTDPTVAGAASPNPAAIGTDPTVHAAPSPPAAVGTDPTLYAAASPRPAGLGTDPTVYAAATPALASVPTPTYTAASGRSRTKLAVALLVGVVLVIAAAVWLRGGDDPPGASPTEGVAVPDREVPVADPPKAAVKPEPKRRKAESAPRRTHEDADSKAQSEGGGGRRPVRRALRRIGL